MANVNIELGYKNLVWFTTNPTLVLLAGQIVYLEQTGTYKIGDGVTQLSVLSFLGISSETQTLQNVTDLGNVTTNNIEANSFIKTGGVSTDVLLADGSTTTLVTKTSDLTNDGDDGNPFISLNDLPSSLTLYATNVASDIPTYFKLVSSITDPSYNTTPVNIPTGAITTTGQLIATLATSANIIVGNPGVFNITTIGNIQKLSGTGNAEFYFEVWQRTLAGVETLITVSGSTLPVLNSGYAEFSASALWNNGTFLSTDRIVLKYYADRIVTGSDPTYQFQFGGLIPVRSLVPIPLNVVPVLKLDDLQDVTATTPNNNEILTYESSTSLWKNKTVVSALGFTPYDSANPSGYITSSALTGLVPYTGATANVNLGTFSLTTPTINGVSGLLSFGSTDVLNIGNGVVNTSGLGIVRIGQGTSWLDFGQKSTGIASLWANQSTPTVNNFCFGGTVNDSYFNAPGGGSGNIYLQNANSIIVTFARFNFIFAPLQNNYGGNKTSFTFTNPNNLNQTNGIATPSLLYNGGSRQWLTGNIATQSEIIWGATTYSFVAASTITNAYGNVFNAPIAGTNATITNRFAALFNQQISLTQTVTTETVAQTRTVTIVINGVTYKLLAA